MILRELWDDHVKRHRLETARRLRQAHYDLASSTPGSNHAQTAAAWLLVLDAESAAFEAAVAKEGTGV